MLKLTHFTAGLAVGLAMATAPLQAAEPLPEYVIEAYGEPPAVPDGVLSEGLKSALTVAFVDSVAKSSWGRDQTAALVDVVASEDPRVVWIIADLLRFANGPQLNASLVDAASQLLDKDLRQQNGWGTVTDHLIAWDIPAPPGYLDYKRAIFTELVPGWERIFVDGAIDWRLVSWFSGSRSMAKRAPIRAASWKCARW